MAPVASSAVRWLLLVLALCGEARADVHWITHAELHNDALSELTAPYDDAGFTHDNAFSLMREERDLAFGGSFLHRWITSRTDQRRWDQLDLLAHARRTLPHGITTTARFGPTLGGNYGGRKMQNGWHALTDTGPTLDEGLQRTYAGDRRTGVLAGLETRAMFPARGIAQGYAIVDGQLALGAGLHRFQIAGGARAFYRHVGAHVELAVAGYRVVDPSLALPGGYGDRIEVEWRAGIDIRWSRFAIGYQYRANEGGSGEPIGVVWFESRR